MTSRDQNNKPAAKAGRRKRKKEQQGNPKPDQPQSAAPEQPQITNEPDEAAVASADIPPIGAAPPADVPPVEAAAPADTPPVPEAAPADTSPVGLQTIATAYRDYTRRSLAEAQSFVEKLSCARSFDKAFEVQTEFAKQAYDTFVADSRKISQLYGEFVKQAFKPPSSTPRRDG